MHSRNPGYLTINNRRVKVQKWVYSSKRIEISVLVHGYQSGIDLLDQLGQDAVSVEWDDKDAVPARPELTSHQMTGERPVTIHRIEATLWLLAPDSSSELIEERLVRIETELRQVQAELQELRSQRTSPTDTRQSSLRQNLATGQTLIEGDIETDE